MSLAYISDETRLSYRDSGSGLPVIFLHPTPLDGDYWRPLLEHLPQMRAIVPDLRGHGASELGTRLPVGGFARVPDAPVLSMGQLASDILGLLDHLRLASAVFAGCSIGGYILLELWRRAPERMRGLAFVCSKPQPDGEAALEKRVATIAAARDGKASELFDGFARSLVGASTRALRPEVVRELRARMTVTAEAEVALQAGLGARVDSIPTVASITVPVLAIAGAEDASASPAEMEAFRAAPGGCTFQALAAAGHFAAYEHPEAVAARFVAWLHQFEAS